MDENTSLFPASFLKVGKDLTESFILIFQKKWLYLGILFLVVCEAFGRSSMYSYMRLLHPKTTDQPLLPMEIMRNAEVSVVEKMIAATKDLEIVGIVGSFSILTLLSSLTAVAIIILVMSFNKNFKAIKEPRLTRKVSRYSLIACVFFVSIGLSAIYIFENETLVLTSILGGILSVQIVLIHMFTYAEVFLILLLKAVISGGSAREELQSHFSLLFGKTLLIINSLLIFTSTSFLLILIIFPSVVQNLFLSDSQSSLVLIPLSLVNSLITVFAYAHVLLVVIFFMSPFVLVFRPMLSLVDTMRESWNIFKKEYDYYICLILFTVFALATMLVIMQGLSPEATFRFIQNPIEKLHSSFRLLLFNVIMVTFFITLFRNIMQHYQKHLTQR